MTLNICTNDNQIIQVFYNLQLNLMLNQLNFNSRDYNITLFAINLFMLIFFCFAHDKNETLGLQHLIQFWIDLILVLAVSEYQYFEAEVDK